MLCSHFSMHFIRVAQISKHSFVYQAILFHFFWFFSSSLFKYADASCISLNYSTVCHGMSGYGVDSNIALAYPFLLQHFNASEKSLSSVRMAATVEDVDFAVTKLLDAIDFAPWIPGCRSVNPQHVAYLPAFLCLLLAQVSKSCPQTPAPLCVRTMDKFFESLVSFSQTDAACAAISDKSSVRPHLKEKFHSLVVFSQENGPRFNGLEGQCFPGDIVQGNLFCGFPNKELACLRNCATTDCSTTAQTRLLSPSNSTPSPESNQSTIKTVGIIVGSVAGVVVLALLGFFLYHRRKRLAHKKFTAVLTDSGHAPVPGPEHAYTPPQRQASMLYSTSPMMDPPPALPMFTSHASPRAMVESPHSPSAAAASMKPSPSRRSVVSTMSFKPPSVPWNELFQRGDQCVVDEAFPTSVDDELPLTVGDRVEVVSIYDDGWGYVTMLTSMRQGMVPLVILKKETEMEKGKGETGGNEDMSVR